MNRRGWSPDQPIHEIDIEGMNVIKNAPFNFMVPGIEALSIKGKVVNSGPTSFKVKKL